MSSSGERLFDGTSLLGVHITEHIRLLPDISGMCFFTRCVVETREFDRHTEA